MADLNDGPVDVPVSISAADDAFVGGVRIGGDRRRVAVDIADERRKADRRWNTDPLLASVTSDVLQRFGGDVFRLRQRQGWSQAQLAHVAGVSPETILEVEKSHRDLRMSSAVRVTVPFGLIPYLCFQSAPQPALPGPNRAF